jgi:hypothetical protein
MCCSPRLPPFLKLAAKVSLLDTEFFSGDVLEICRDLIVSDVFSTRILSLF